MPAWLREVPGGVELEVLAVPRASRTRIVGEHDGRLKVQLAAPPVEGAANSALVELIGSMLGLPRRSVAVVRGETRRRKTVRAEGASAAQVLARLASAG